MRRLILFSVLMLIAAPAAAIDTTSYPSTLMDQTCTDTEGAPAPYTPPRMILGGLAAVTNAVLIQTSGNADGFCDHDSRIRTGAQGSDTSFGPFSLSDGVEGLYLFVDADTVVGADASWRVTIRARKPHDDALQNTDNTATVPNPGTGNVFFSFGNSAQRPSTATGAVNGPVPDVFYLTLGFVAATSITADVSLVLFR